MGWTEREIDKWVVEERRKNRKAQRRVFWDRGGGVLLLGVPLLIGYILILSFLHQ